MNRSQTRFFVCCVACTATLACLVSRGADDELRDKVVLLAHERTAAAKAAFVDVVKMGEAAIPGLKELAVSADEDVARTAGKLLRIIRKQVARKEINLDASRVTLDVKDKPVRDVLRGLEADTGNTIVIGALKDGAVTLAVKDAPFWEVLDAVCAQTGNTYGPDPCAGGG